MSRSVTTPAGECWRVGRRWLPRRAVRWKAPKAPRRRRGGRDAHRRGSALDWFDGFQIFDADNPLGGLLFLLGVVVFVAVLWFFVVPLLLVLIDVAVLGALAVAGILARVVLRRPWEVEAVGPTSRLTWRVAGWSRSGRAVAAISERLARGEIPPTDAPEFPSR